MSRNTGDREGPALITVSHESCLGCKWHEQDMIKSSWRPEYQHSCNHPDADPRHRVYIDSYAARIGDSDRTPNWCPVKLAAQEAAEPPTVTPPEGQS